MGDFRKLKVWEKAHALALRTYQVTGTFPKAETYGLVSQLRRAAVSIGSNLAEGTGRGSKREMAYFVRLSLGSTHELQYQFLLARDLGWISGDIYPTLEASAKEVRAMLEGLRRSMEGGPDR